MKTITAQVNQSLQDIILQATGTLEGALVFCQANGIGISYNPTPGEVFVLPEGIVTNEAELRRMAEEGIVLGTANLGVCGLATAEEVTVSYRTATFDINAGTGGEAVQYAVTVAGADAPTDGTTVEAGEVSLAGLEPETEYVFWYRTKCWGSYSAWQELPFETIAAPVLNWREVLKPVENLIVGGTPKRVAMTKNVSSFVNLYPLLPTYLTTNTVQWQSANDYLGGVVETITTQTSLSTGMSGGVVDYIAPTLPEPGEIRVYWNDLEAPILTITFKDINGNQAEICPVIFVNDTYTSGEYLLGALTIALVEQEETYVKLRVTKSHAAITTTNVALGGMFWLHDALGGTPDPLDPTNENKTILTLATGNYKMGVLTTYTTTGGALDWPKSRFTMVINVY